jgi:hypothetical protein
MCGSEQGAVSRQKHESLRTEATYSAQCAETRKTGAQRALLAQVSTWAPFMQDELSSRFVLERV